MVEPEVTVTWTPEYVIENRQKCLSFLQAMNLLAVRYIEKRRYASAVTSLDQLLNGLEVMHNSRRYGDLRSHMSFLSFVEGVIMAFANPEAMTREAAELGRSTKYTPEQFREKSLEIARDLVADAQDFARAGEMKQSLAPLLEVLERGNETVQQFRDEEFPDHPEEILEMYRNFNARMFDPLIERGVSTIPLPPGDQRARSGVREEVAREKKQKARKHRAYPPGRFQSFGAWAQANGWDEEDLAKVYRSVRFRKNLYAVLSCTPLVILFVPFYFLASDLVEVLRLRDLKAKGRTSNLTAGLMGVFILVWLLIPPLVTSLIFGLIIYLTGWGMGLGKRHPRPEGWTAGLQPAPAPAAMAPVRERSSGSALGKVALVALCGLVAAVVYIAFFTPVIDGFPPRPQPASGISQGDTGEPAPSPDAPSGGSEGDPGPGEGHDLEGVTWVSVRRERDAVRVESYRFQDGEVIYHLTPYQNAALEPLGEEEGWYVLPMGHPDYYGDYRLEGEDLVIDIRGNTYQPESPEATRVLALDWDDSGDLLLDGKVFLPDADPDDLEGLCARLGVDLSVE